MRPVPGDPSRWTVHDASGVQVGGAGSSGASSTSVTASSSHPPDWVRRADCPAGTRPQEMCALNAHGELVFLGEAPPYGYVPLHPRPCPGPPDPRVQCFLNEHGQLVASAVSGGAAQVERPGVHCVLGPVDQEHPNGWSCTNIGNVAGDNGNGAFTAVTPTANESWTDCPHWVTGPCFTRPRAGDRSAAVIYDGQGRVIGVSTA